MTRLGRFLAGLALVLLVFELGFRSLQGVLFDASHRALFKVALLDRRPEVSAVVLGSSRNGAGFLPRLFDARMKALGHEVTSFNLAVSGLSYELEVYLLQRLAGKTLDVVVFELGDPVLGHAPLDWEAQAAPLDALARHLVLLRLRSALRHDSLARLLAIGVAGPRLDGSETYGTEYAAALLGARSPESCQRCEGVYPTPEPAPSSAAAPSAEARGFAPLLGRLQQAGAAVILVVPPLSPTRLEGNERKAEFRAHAEGLSQLIGAPLYTLTEAAQDGDLRDWQHMGPQGAERYTDVLARLCARALSSRAPRDATSGGALRNALQ